MRITCPNCLAQYDIDDTLLPKDGREVQCSSCDHVWFQTPIRKKAESPRPEDSPPEPAGPAKPAAAATPKSAPAPKASPSDSQITSATPPWQSPPPPQPEDDAPAPPSDKPARKLDPAVADVLRKEAAFEEQQRRKEAEGLHSQPELGLMGGAPWPAEKTPPTEAERKHDATDATAHNAHNFPDIEDVSATLEPVDARRRQGRAESAQDFALPQTAQARRRSFLSGFALPLIIAGIGLALYYWAEDLSQLAPPLQAPLAAYVALVDQGRAALLALIGGG